MRTLLKPLGLLLLVSAAQADSVSVIELQHRPAEEVIPIVQPMLEPGNAITGTGFKLFLQSSPETAARVRSIIDMLDTPARTLQVSVFQGSASTLREFAARATLRAEGGGASYGTSGGSVSVDGISTQQSLRDNPIHQVRVTEGKEAYIETGEQIPYFYGAAFAGRRAVAGAVEYRDVVTGFYVLPRIRGDNVTLEVSPFKNSPSDTGGGNVETQAAATTITGSLGEWLLVGSVTEQVERSETGIGTTYSTRGKDAAGIWIKADLVE
ncbi:MAG: hypothetical protein QNI96_05785 [Woeseiaceae bacterium]|nr:hypothetical protein [Woeseiaceae bacterium]